MIRLDIREYGQEEWNAIVDGFDDASLLQTWEWGEAKARTGPWGVRRGTFLAGERVVGAFQALVRRLPLGLPGGLVWINRGPLWHATPDQGMAPLKVMMEALRHRFAEQGRFYLRIVPPAADESFPEGDYDRLGFAPAGAAGWASAVLDLSPPPEALRKGLKQKWRNCLNKGEKLGLELRIGTDAALFDDFVDAHARFHAERGFETSVTPELLRAWRALLPEFNWPEVLMAYKDGELVGSVLVAGWGRNCEYLAGNTSDVGRKLNAGQVLLWQAVAKMRERGYLRFDLGGLDPQLTPAGIRRFKEGLSGTPYRLAAEAEAVGGGFLGQLVRWKVGRARA